MGGCSSVCYCLSYFVRVPGVTLHVTGSKGLCGAAGVPVVCAPSATTRAFCYHPWPVFAPGLACPFIRCACILLIGWHTSCPSPSARMHPRLPYHVFPLVRDLQVPIRLPCVVYS